MNSSQTHLLTQINLADMARQVGSVEQHLRARMRLMRVLLLLLYLTSVALEAQVMEGRCQSVVIYCHPRAVFINLTDKGRWACEAMLTLTS